MWWLADVTPGLELTQSVAVITMVIGAIVVRVLDVLLFRSRVQLPTAALPSSDPGQVVHLCPAPI